VEGITMNKILNVREKVNSDESISKKEFHTYSSYNQTFKPNDEIPHERYLSFQLIIRKDSPNGPEMIMLPNKWMYEINGCGIDITRFVGLTTTLKNSIYLFFFGIPL